jgi:hypothetical protein
MIQKKWAIVLGVSLVIGSAAATAAGSGENSSDIPKTVIESFDLAYNPKSSSRGLATAIAKIPNKHIPKLTGKKWSDGSWTIEGKGEYESGRPCFSIEYQVDKKTKTYSITPIANHGLDDSYLELQASNSRVNPEALSSEPSVAAASNNSSRCEVPTDAVAPATAAGATFQAQFVPGNYKGYATVRTRDVPNWTITATMGKLAWGVNYNGSVSWQMFGANWYAVNPSPINTHWYISQQNYSGPTYALGQTSVSANVYGAYYNYDWLFSSLITTANQSVTITGKNNGFYDYWWTHNDAGESSSLIWGVLTLNAW